MANVDETLQIQAINDIGNAEEHNVGMMLHNNRQNPFEHLTDIQFKKDFRLTKEMTIDLINRLVPILGEQTRKSAIDARTKVVNNKLVV